MFSAGPKQIPLIQNIPLENPFTNLSVVLAVARKIVKEKSRLFFLPGGLNREMFGQANQTSVKQLRTALSSFSGG